MGWHGPNTERWKEIQVKVLRIVRVLEIGVQGGVLTRLASGKKTAAPDHVLV